jgi:hypothetical protein
MVMSLNRKSLKNCIEAAAVIIAAHPEVSNLIIFSVYI